MLDGKVCCTLCCKQQDGSPCSPGSVGMNWEEVEQKQNSFFLRGELEMK